MSPVLALNFLSQCVQVVFFEGRLKGYVPSPFSASFLIKVQTVVGFEDRDSFSNGAPPSGPVFGLSLPRVHFDVALFQIDFQKIFALFPLASSTALPSLELTMEDLPWWQSKVWHTGDMATPPQLVMTVASTLVVFTSR